MAAITAAPGRRPFPVDFYFYLPGERCCRSASRRSPLQTPAAPPLLITTAGPLGRDAATCLCDLISAPPPPPPTPIHIHTLVPRVLIKQITPPLPPLPSSSHCSSYHNGGVIDLYLCHDASQLAVVTPSACHWYSPPPPSLPLNDFLLPLASFPLPSPALHKSTRSLDPSKANDHHLFSSAPVSFFNFSPWHTFFCLHVHTHIQMCPHACAHTVCVLLLRLTRRSHLPTLNLIHTDDQ